MNASIFTPYISDLAGLIRSNLHEVCFGITAVSLVLAGPTINGLVKKLSGNLHWLLRYLVFIVLCTVGYGLLSQVVFKTIREVLLHLSSMYLLLWTAVIYLVLAWFAKQAKEI